MATAIELVGDELEDQRGRLLYQVRDAEFAATARSLVNALAPIFWGGLIKQDVRVEEIGAGVWQGEVPYGTLERPEAGSIPWSFELGTATVHITQGKEHIADYAASGPGVNHKGTIGVRDDGNGQSAEGCDVHVPFFKWSETHYFPAAIVASHAWIQVHEALVATVNEAPWRVWQKGELLLLGSTGAKQAELDVPITYTFASSRTRTGMTIGDITGVNKEGHYYLWLDYFSEEDAPSNDMAYRPKGAHVERVYDYADWATYLPLPDPWN